MASRVPLGIVGFATFAMIPASAAPANRSRTVGMVVWVVDVWFSISISSRVWARD